jgi:hypothetical protein
MCPTCRRLANCIVPILPTCLLPTQHDGSDTLDDDDDDDPNNTSSISALVQGRLEACDEFCEIQIPQAIQAAQSIEEPPPRITPMCPPVPPPSQTNSYTASNCCDSLHLLCSRVHHTRNAIPMVGTIAFAEGDHYQTLSQLVCSRRSHSLSLSLSLSHVMTHVRILCAPVVDRKDCIARH